LLAVDVGVQHTQDVLELLAGHQGLRSRGRTSLSADSAAAAKPVATHPDEACIRRGQHAAAVARGCQIERRRLRTPMIAGDSCPFTAERGRLRARARLQQELGYRACTLAKHGPRKPFRPQRLLQSMSIALRPDDIANFLECHLSSFSTQRTCSQSMHS
jgi:hypothetical protein